MTARVVDFKYQPSIDGLGVSRNGDTFRLAEPWGEIEVNTCALSPGWWFIDYAGQSDDLQICFYAGPRLIFAYAASAGRSRVFRLGRDPITRVRLMVSAWPGEYIIDRLALRRMSTRSVALLFIHRIVRLRTSERPLLSLLAAMRRLVTGRSFGAQEGVAPVPQTRAPTAAPAEHALERQIKIDLDGLCALASVEDQFDQRAIPLIRRLFDERPAIQAVYGDVWEVDHITPKPQWDEVLADYFDFAGLPIFLRDGLRDDRPAAELLKSIVYSSGPSSVLRIPLPIAARSATPQRRLHVPPLPNLQQAPSVSVIIPTKIRHDLLHLCLEGLIRETDHKIHEVVIVDNGSTDPRIAEAIRRASAHLNLIILRDEGGFNFSRLINRGVERSSGEVVLLLNDDVRPLRSDWLGRMLSSAVEPDAGAIGARLLYPSGDIQHAGVVVRADGVGEHMWRNLSPDRAAANPYVILPSRRLAVTAACLAVQRAAFDAVGGFDEALAVTLNDVDFCLKLHTSGKRNIYRGDAVLLHAESQSRGEDASAEARARGMAEADIFRRRWAQLGADPYGSPLFDPSTDSGAVLAPAFKA